MVDFQCKPNYAFDDLLQIMRLLRGPGGCPWDHEQTHGSIRQNCLEEAYEVCEAIDKDDMAGLREELGDLLLQVVFHAQIEQEAGGFSMNDVVDEICKKLVTRHPHVFGDASAQTASDVLSLWDDVKRETKGQTSRAATMESVARSLPALMRAVKIQKQAKKVGFDWESADGAWDKLSEECGELREAAAGLNVADPSETARHRVADELGDVLFSVCNVARFLEVDPERALESSCDKFVTRFGAVETAVLAAGLPWSTYSLEELDLFWQAAKSREGQE